jgi:hypothetical protein
MPIIAQTDGLRGEFEVRSVRILPQDFDGLLLALSHVMDAKSARPSVSRPWRHGTRRMRGIMFGAGVISLLLTACAIPRDTRTPAEKDRDAEIWTHALSLKVAIARTQLEECERLGVVSERYYEDVPSDPMKRTGRMPWPEHMLRFKTAQLGGNAALMKTPVAKWKQDELVQSRVLGEALRCAQPTIATR